MEKGKKTVISILKASVNLMEYREKNADTDMDREYWRGKISGLCIAISVVEGNI